MALLGSNGAGKTTTLKTIMRLLYDLKEEQPEKGTIDFMGERIDRKDTDEIVRMGISYVPEGREVFPELTVMENILMGAYTRKDPKAIKEDVENVYGHFPILKERKNQQAGYLSGGEQQMLAIGRALMSRPKLLMLDEPSLGLSPLLTREIFKIIRGHQPKRGGDDPARGAERQHGAEVRPLCLSSWKTAGSSAPTDRRSCARTRMSRSSTWASPGKPRSRDSSATGERCDSDEQCQEKHGSTRCRRP